VAEPVVGCEGGVGIGAPGSVDDEAVEVTPSGEWDRYGPRAVAFARQRGLRRIPAIEITYQEDLIGLRRQVDESNDRVGGGRRNRGPRSDSISRIPDRRLAAPVREEGAAQDTNSYKAGSEESTADWREGECARAEQPPPHVCPSLGDRLGANGRHDALTCRRVDNDRTARLAGDPFDIRMKIRVSHS
jgi:hypothetical protein